MSRMSLTLLLTTVIVGGGWALYHRDQIQSPEDALRLLTSQISNATEDTEGQPRLPAQLSGWATPVVNSNSIRVATFNVQALSDEKLTDENTLIYLAKIFQKFDVVAVQEVRASDPALLQRFVRRINEGQLNYAYALSPVANTGTQAEQSAFIFNQDTVRLDDAFTYSVHDPEGVLQRPPFVGWFRAAAPRPHLAFTFTLVNVHFQTRRTADELAYLPQLFRAVRKDGRGEDDVIILGDFQAGDRGLIPSGQQVGLSWAIQNKPTDTLGTQQLDNLLFDARSTTEFTGEAGVFDFLKHFNLGMEEAMRISDHMPVWAEFSILEGAAPGRVASEEPSPRR